MKPTSFGHFSPDGKEFILRRPLLDRPWMNVLSNGNWCYVASHLGGGYSFLGDPTVGRITRWHVDGVPRDTTGKFVYLRDDESGEWWTANGYPPTRPLDDWECHIGLGYNRILACHKGISSDILYFTPMPDPSETGRDTVGDACLIWRVSLKNTSTRKRIISVSNYVELALGNWYEDTSWREFYLLFNRQDYKNEVLYTRSSLWVKHIGGWQAMNSEANNISFDHAVFLASTAAVTGFEGDRYKFIGSYRDLRDPQAMDTGKLSCNVSTGRDTCEVLQHRFELEPGEEVTYVLLLGAVPAGATDASVLTEKFLSIEKAEAAFENNQDYWKKVVSNPRIETPDSDLNLLVNDWFKYQAANLAWWNRNTGYCYSGIYNFGIRDACQDAAARLPQDAGWVRETIVNRIMIWQFEEGDYAHGGNFISMSGTRTFHSDDPINPVFILARYVRETGDFSILKEITPYAHTHGQKTDTIYTHIIKGLEFFFSQFSERGLPLILKADWNDALDQMGNQRKGDSVMLACWAVYCLREFFVCMEYMEDFERLALYRQRIDCLAETVNQIAWDGEWYQRAMHDSGWILGSRDNKYGKIWSNPNAFAIVSGVASAERREVIYASFDRYLDHELGSHTFFPPFDKPDPRAGVISRFAPGTKENGSIFGHSSRWRIWAECYGGRGDKAYDIFHKMSPITRHETDPDLYQVEPYVACQFIYGPESDCPGEGSHSWATGTAAWSLIVVWEWLLGVRAEEEGLRIDPCLPSEWTWACMTRRYRDSTYHIRIQKPKGICKGRVNIILDGMALTTNLIPPQMDGKDHQVEVFLSASAVNNINGMVQYETTL
jgi:cellobiose phosphorylase